MTITMATGVPATRCMRLPPLRSAPKNRDVKMTSRGWLPARNAAAMASKP
jgi:hypothetical protein